MERKFNDICNPPYKNGLDLSFLERSIEKDKVKRLVFLEPAIFLFDKKGNPRYNKIKRLLDGKVRLVKIIDGNKKFDEVEGFTPLAILSYDSNYNGKCQVDCFGDKYETDVWGITMLFGENWEPIVKPFMNKMTTVCKKGNDVWSHNKTKISNNKHYCQLAVIRGNVNTIYEEQENNSKMVRDDFFTMLMKDTNKNKGIRQPNLTKPGNPIPVFEFGAEVERDNFIDYLKTNFARFCLALLKNNGNLSVGEMSLIPWLDFTQKWNDEKLFLHFGIDEKTQKYISEFLPDFHGINKKHKNRIEEHE